MKLLNKFYADFQVKAEVKEYFIEHLRKQAVDRAFNGEDTTGIMEARKCIELAFRDLDKQYSVKEKKQPTSNR